MPFVVDDVAKIVVVIDSTNGDITTSIASPFGEINETTIGSFGGELLSYGDMEETESGIMSGLFFGAGFKWVYVFPSPGPGTYTMNLNADPALAEEVAVIITMILDSPVATMLATTRQTVTVGETVVVTVGVFEGTSAVRRRGNPAVWGRLTRLQRAPGGHCGGGRTAARALSEPAEATMMPYREPVPWLTPPKKEPKPPLRPRGNRSQVP